MSTETIYNAIFSDDDIKWQSIIYELIRSKKIDPWDIDLNKFSQEYLSTIDKLKKLNFRISGKVVFAAAIMLKIKTKHLGLDDFILLSDDKEEENNYDEDYYEDSEYLDPDEEKIMKLSKHIRHNTKKKYLIEPNLNATRKRKVTVVELMDALKKAIEVDRRREKRRVKAKVVIPDKIYEAKKDLLPSQIVDLRKKINELFNLNKKQKIEFNKLLNENTPKEKVSKFLPILHIATDGHIAIHQDKPFSEMLLEVIKNERS